MFSIFLSLLYSSGISLQIRTTYQVKDIQGISRVITRAETNNEEVSKSNFDKAKKF